MAGTKGKGPKASMAKAIKGKEKILKSLKKCTETLTFSG
jgi:hypothetical protein